MGALPLACLVLAMLPSLALATPFWKGNSTVRVCAADAPPMLSCSGKQPGRYEGYEVKLFDQVTSLLGWTKADYEWACPSYDSFEEERRNGSCDIAVGIMSWDQDLKDGFAYSDSIWRGGLQIGVLTTSTVPGLFTFMSVFTWQVWMAVVLTAIFIALVVWTVDSCLVGPPHLDVGDGGARQYSTYMWEALGRPMQTREIVAKSFAGNLVLLIFSFSMLVMVSLFTAQTASDMTVKQINGQIEGLQDLAGKTVGTFEDIRGLLLDHYSINPAKVYPWAATGDTQVMYQALRSGEIQALIMDSTVLQIETSGQCDLGIKGELFGYSDQVFSFRIGLNNTELVRHVNEALAALRDDGSIEQLVQKYITKPLFACNDALTETGITFRQVAGLWILMACAVGIAVLLIIMRKVHVRYFEPRIVKMRTAVGLQRAVTTANVAWTRATSFGSADLHRESKAPV